MKIIKIVWINAVFSKKSSKKFVGTKKNTTFATALRAMLLTKGKVAEIAQLVEHNLAKVGVAGSSPVFRSHIEQKRVLKIGFNSFMPRWRNW